MAKFLTIIALLCILSGCGVCKKSLKSEEVSKTITISDSSKIMTLNRYFDIDKAQDLEINIVREKITDSTTVKPIVKEKETINIRKKQTERQSETLKTADTTKVNKSLSEDKVVKTKDIKKANTNFNFLSVVGLLFLVGVVVWVLAKLKII